MKENYQFTLVLKGLDENTPGLEDALYEAGCDDALINFRNGTVYLDFDRQASSLKEAVITAIKAVECSSLGGVVASVAPEDWVTESDIAKRTASSRQIVSLWTKDKRRKLFPKPVMKLSERSPFWKWKEIVQWLYKNGLTNEQEVKKAEFIEDINAVLEERDPKIRMARKKLLQEFRTTSVR